MFLGIDLGTSGIKLVLVDDAQAVVASSAAPLVVQHPHDGWAEQNPADWITACEAAFDALARSAPQGLAAVKGIGLSGQMHGATLLDRADNVLRPCILWNDTRAHRQAAVLDAMPQVRALSGNIVFPGFTAPKLMWCAEHEPELFAKVSKVLLPKDYLRLWLTGEYVTDMSDASGTAWLDVGGRDWSDALLSASSMTRSQMPGLVEGSAASGQMRPELAQRWGLPAGVIVAGGAGDNAAAGIGTGVTKAGAGFVSLGTSGVLFAAADSYRPNAQSAVHTFCHALPDTWHQMGVILSATAGLEWFARICGTTAAVLDGEQGNTLFPPEQSLFLPYLSGERTPHNDARLRGGFIGLTPETDRAAMTRTVMEGVAFALRDNQAALQSAGADPARFLAVGGGTRSEYWLKLIATVLERPVDVPQDGDFGAAFGAARLAMLATGHGDVSAVCIPPKIVRSIDPDPAQIANYSAAYQRFKSKLDAARI